MSRRRQSKSSPAGAVRSLFGARWFLRINLGVALLLGGWYFAQPATRQQEVQQLVRAAMARDKHVSALDVARDIWQLYYADPAAGRIPAGDKTHLWGGTPVPTAGPQASLIRVLVNRGYVVGYNDARGSPAWAAYHVRDLAQLPAALPRPAKFSIDRRTTARIAPESYNDSGYDRGHLAPNYVIASRYGAVAQEETFLMSNIAPQRHALNAGVWKELEMKIANAYPARYQEVWVFAGPIFGEHPRELRGGVEIPEAFWMIVVDEHEAKARTLALIVPQDAPPSMDLGRCLTSIDEIERRTQLDLFPELDDGSETIVEAQLTPRVW